MRTYIKELKNKIGEEVSISGWVDTRRDHGKLTFVDLRDVSGKIQCVDTKRMLHEVRSEWVLALRGIVRSRPAKLVNPEQPQGDIEFEVQGVEILSKAKELPFELSAKVNLDTYLDYLPLTLRTQFAKDIFTLQATLVDAYRQSLRRQGFTEFQAPALVGGDAEGGAAVFKVEYLYEKTAYLATSPQLYKQIMVGPFERAFTIAKIFRAEKHATTRHLSELTQMDFEMGFIRDHRDVMAVLETTVRETATEAIKEHGEIFKRFETPLPLVEERFPVLTLTEAQEIIEREFGGKTVGELDLEPEHERQICEWAKDKYRSDFIFITAFPTKKRAFYTYESPDEAPFSRSFDLLFRGLEINSGAQRIHDYDTLVSRIIERGLDPNKFSFYLQAFKYGMPPHGGSSTGLERLTARMLNLPNVKQASAFPRDINRIDQLLS